MASYQNLGVIYKVIFASIPQCHRGTNQKNGIQFLNGSKWMNVWIFWMSNWIIAWKSRVMFENRIVGYMFDIQ